MQNIGNVMLFGLTEKIISAYYEVFNMRGCHGRDDAASIPIFAMSANAFVEDRQAAKEAGMDVHIAKPIDAELLKKKIAEYCR